MRRQLKDYSNSYEFYKKILNDLINIYENSNRQDNVERQYNSFQQNIMLFIKFYVDFIRLKQVIKKNKNNMIRHLRLKIREDLRKNWDVYKNFHKLQGVKKYLRKLNNIQRVEYEEKFKSFIRTAFSIKKSIITITSRTRIIITIFIKFIISIIFVKIKIENAKKLICYNYN